MNVEQNFINKWVGDLGRQKRAIQKLYSGASDAIEQVSKVIVKMAPDKRSVAASKQIVSRVLMAWQKKLDTLEKDVALYKGFRSEDPEASFDEFISHAFGVRGVSTSMYIHDDASVSYQSLSSYQCNVPDEVEDFETLVPWAKGYYTEGIYQLEAMMKQLDGMEVQV